VGVGDVQGPGLRVQPPSMPGLPVIVPEEVTVIVANVV